MSLGNCRKCTSELSIPTENPNFAQIPTCKNCTPQAFGIRRPDSGKVGEKEYEAAKIYAGLDRRRNARDKIREAGSVCRACGDSLQMSDVVTKDADGRVTQGSVPACPTCNREKFNQTPKEDTGEVAGATPEENERLAFNKQQETALSTHYSNTGSIHLGSSTIADYTHAQGRGKIALAHPAGQSCIHGCTKDTNVDKWAPVSLVVHQGDMRTPEQKDPYSRTFVEKPILTTSYTHAKFNWKKSPADGMPTNKLENHPVGQTPNWTPSWSQDVDESSTGEALMSAHSRGAHEGRKIDDCPSCL